MYTVLAALRLTLATRTTRATIMVTKNIGMLDMLHMLGMMMGMLPAKEAGAEAIEPAGRVSPVGSAGRWASRAAWRTAVSGA